MSGSIGRVYSFYNQNCGLGPQYFNNWLDGKVCPSKKMTLYYRLSTEPGYDASTNASNTKFVTDPTLDTYRGISNRYMTESDFQTYNTNILTFIGYRTPSNEELIPEMRVPDMYNETINVNIEPYDINFIQATANYIDNGSGLATTVPFVDYKVNIATGIFNGFTNMRINFYNDGNPPGFPNGNLGKVRIMTLT